MKRALALVVGALGIAALSPMAMAQDMAWGTIIPSVAGTDQLGIVLREQVRRPPPGRIARPRIGVREPAGAVAPNPAALRYSPSKARRAANLARFVEKTRKADPAGAKDLADAVRVGRFHRQDRSGDRAL